jgi:hypothetical protein
MSETIQKDARGGKANFGRMICVLRTQMKIAMAIVISIPAAVEKQVMIAH